MIKAVIFDFFGVLVGDGFDSTYRIAGGDPAKDKDFIEDLLDHTNRGLLTSGEFRQSICEKLGISVDDYHKAVSQSEQVNLELLDYIETLRPKYKTAILSNVNKGGLERRIKREVLDKYFDATIVSGDIGLIKPEPEIYYHTAKELGVQPQDCVFIDDREPYTIGAEKVGMKSMLYKDFKQMKTELEQILAGDDSGANN